MTWFWKILTRKCWCQRKFYWQSMVFKCFQKLDIKGISRARFHVSSTLGSNFHLGDKSNVTQKSPLVQKIKIINLTNSNMQNSMVTFPVLDREYPFWENFVRKNKIVSLSWTLLRRLIWTCWIQWWCSLFSVLNQKYSFWPNLVQKMKIVTLNWNQNIQNSIVVFTLFVLDWKCNFWANLVKKVKIFSFNWN